MSAKLVRLVMEWEQSVKRVKRPYFDSTRCLVKQKKAKIHLGNPSNTHLAAEKGQTVIGSTS